jgi:multiple sugar transport system substrate-binding protein
MRTRGLLSLTLIVVLLVTACGGTTAPEPTQPPQVQATTAPVEPTTAPAANTVKDLTIMWAQWDPADYLQEIGKLYEQETGIKVTVLQEPWGSFYDRVAAEWAAKGSAFDMVVGDSQWLGQGATQGHYLDLTEFMTGNGLDKTVTPATLTYYGEYPTGSKTYWAFPTEGDAVGWAYRKDLFENPDEQAAFKAKYGYELAVPTTWDQLRDIAEFFTRPDKNLYGVALYTQKDYDAITMGFENVFFSYGADWKDPATNEVQGVLNSPEAVKALEFYKELYRFEPPGGSNDFYAETNNHFIAGEVAMAMNYFAFLPALSNPATNPFAAGTGFFVQPKGPTGLQRAALGGQGLSVSAYVSPERQQAAKDFIKWFGQEDIQNKWAELGGYTCNTNVLNSDTFRSAQVYNPAFAETMQIVMDYWNVPVYGKLLESTQRLLQGYVVGGQGGTAQQVMDTMVAEHEQILREAGLIK